MTSKRKKNELGKEIHNEPKYVQWTTNSIFKLNEDTYINFIDNELWDDLGKSIWDELWNSFISLGDSILYDFEEKEE